MSKAAVAAKPVKTPEKYKDKLDKLDVGEYVLIDAGERVNVTMYCKRNYPDKVFSYRRIFVPVKKGYIEERRIFRLK